MLVSFAHARIALRVSERGASVDAKMYGKTRARCIRNGRKCKKAYHEKAFFLWNKFLVYNHNTGPFKKTAALLISSKKVCGLLKEIKETIM
jgi:hypothetical protein